MSGYIGNIPVPQATQTRQSFTATASQTTFNTAGYSPGYIDVFLNGVKLAPADYTATNGSDVVLAVGAASGDILETVAYEIFQVLDQDFTGDFTVDTDTFVVDSVNDRVGVGTASPMVALNVHDSTDARIALTNSSTGQTFPDGFELLATGLDAYVQNRSNGNMVFTTNNTERMRIDSSGNVGIGTTSPSETLHINSGGNNTGLFIESTDANSNLIFRDSDSTANVALGCVGDDFRIQNSGSEKMRIDSSGNLLVGTTTADGSTGSTLYSTGQIRVNTSSITPAIFNRATNDGDIITLRKDGTTVGSIGSRSGRADIEINTTLGSGRLNAAGTGVMGWNNVPEVFPHTDNSTNLGSNTNRWNNLYLSGGVYLGGTGSANKLDDVESGTWTATIGGTAGNPTSVNYLAQASLYTKVGDIVTVTGIIGFSTYTGGSGTLTIAGLPYAAASVAQNYACGACLLENVVLTSGYTYAVARTVLNQTYLEVIETGSNVGWRGIQMSQYPSNSSGKYVNFTVTYRAA